MNISLNWFKDYIDTDLSAEQIGEILMNVGFPCESIEQVEGDTVLDIEITSNRGDCLGHIGLAREVAAFTGTALKIPDVQLDESEKDVTELCSVEIADPDLCGRYTARVIEGVKVGPTPDWMKKRLEAIGLRSVNNVVDATNYAMMECGQPPHAFDYSTIQEGKVIVRKAKPGEQIVSIDGSKCDLTPDMLVISDPQKAIGIAGVMGGLHTEVKDDTTTILLEEASFDPVTVRTASRRLILPSDAAYRFERIVDIENIEWASRRTAQLICQVAGGKVAKGIVDIYPAKAEPQKVTMRSSRLNKLIGMEIPAADALDILTRLSFAPIQQGDDILCTVPTWRSDVYREADLIEEVIRVYGYDKVPTEKRIEIEAVNVDPRQKLSLKIGNYLNACGYYETINVTFVDDKTSEIFAVNDGKEHLAVSDESRKSANRLRQMLIGSLMGVLKTNLNARNKKCKIFEIADTFVPSGDGLPLERTKLGIICDGQLRELTGVVEGLIRSFDKDAQVTFVPADIKWAKAAAEVKVNNQIIGSLGIISDKVKKAYDIKEATPCAAELDFELLGALEAAEVKVKPIPRFPAIERDLSLIVDEPVAWSAIAAAVEAAKSEKLEDLRFTDIYRGKGIAAGKKSVTLSLCFRDEDGTLTHEQVDALEKTIVDSLKEKVKAEIRTA